jgi:hypothetical protein
LLQDCLYSQIGFSTVRVIKNSPLEPPGLINAVMITTIIFDIPIAGK